MLKEKFVVLILIVSVLTGLSTSYVHAQSDALFWAPAEILLKEKYQGLIVVDFNITEDAVFEVVTDNEEVIRIISDTVIIPKGKHHGLVEFETVGTGSAEIYAIFQDTLLKETVNVVESAESPTTLDLILPSNLVNVLADENKHTGYVFLLNDFNNPVIAKNPIPVTLTSNGEISLTSKSLMIESGKHYAKFQFEAHGEGTISASAPNLMPDEEDISLDDTDEIELKIAVAPDPIPTDSSGEVYFWLERDGDPYVAPHNVKVTISIDKSANLSFDSAIEGAIVLTPNTSDRRSTEANAKEIITRTQAQLSLDSKKDFVLEAGQHYGKTQVYASFDEASGIKINGLAESINPKQDEETIKASEIFDINTEKSSFGTGTQTRVFAFPDPAYKQVEIIISSYSDDGPIIERDDESFTVFTNNKVVIEPESKSHITRDKNYEVVVAKILDYGGIEIFAERNEAESDEISIEASGKYVKNPDLDIVTFPVIFNIDQDLFLVSSSQEKIKTNISDDNEGNLISITTRPDFEFETIQESESVITIKGKITQLLENDPDIHVASNAFTDTEQLKVYNPERKKLNSFHPNQVYPGEVFPVITHVNDLDGNPIRKEMLKISSVATMGTVDGLFYFNQTGKHDIIFFDKNSVPIKSTITVKGFTPKPSEISSETQIPTVPTYVIEVIGGSGSGEYEEDEEVTISAPSTKDDIIIIKKKFVGWENLQYKEPTVTFEADDNITTRPIYEDDYSLLFAITVIPIGIAAFIVIKKKKSKQGKKQTKENDLTGLLDD